MNIVSRSHNGFRLTDDQGCTSRTVWLIADQHSRLEKWVARELPSIQTGDSGIKIGDDVRYITRHDSFVGQRPAEGDLIVIFPRVNYETSTWLDLLDELTIVNIAKAPVQWWDWD